MARDDPALLEKIIALLVTTRSRAAAEKALIEKQEIPADKARRLVRKAHRAVALAAHYDADEELGAAIRRLNDCYARAAAIQDTKTALVAQRELNKLLDLYHYRRPPSTVPGQDTAAGVEAAGDLAAEELAGARAHLAPLFPRTDADSLAELARLAAGELIAHRAKEAPK